MKRIWWLLAGIALLAMACSVGNLAGGSQATEPTQAPKPTQSKILFQDDFSDPSSGWDQVKDDDGSLTDYVDGHYRILVNDTQADIWANPGKSFDGDIVVLADAVKNSGPDDNDFGLICRYKDKNNFYFFIISSDGYAAIGKIDHGSQIIISDDGSMVEADIPTGDGQTYHLEARCIGSHLALVVNGKTVMEADDETFKSGDVGLMAGTFDEPGTDILFDNFVVKRP